MGAVSSRWLTISILCSSVSALPLAAPSADSSLGLEFPLAFSPILVLLLLKIGYIEYCRYSSSPRQRTESIAGSSLALRIGSYNVYLKLVRTAYLVGFLGSPAWETRTSGSTNHVSRRSSRTHGTCTFTPSPVLYPHVLSEPQRVVQAVAHFIQHRTSRISLNHGARRKQESDDDFHSHTGVHSSICARGDAVPSLSLLAPVHFPSGGGINPPQRSSPSLAQIMEPVISAMVSDPKAPAARICHELQLLAEADYVHSMRQGFLASRPARPRVHTLANDIQGEHDNAGNLDTFTFPIPQDVSITLPPSVHHVSGPRSRKCIPEEWECNQPVPYVTQWTSQVLIDARNAKAQEATRPGLSLGIKAPLSLTTRPLNGITISDCSSSSIPAAEPLSPIAVLAGRRLAPKSKVLRKRRSGSPQIGPSPLRNSLLLDSSTSSVIDDSRPTSTVVSICPNWDLDDLLVDGELDVNAVTAALGLGLSMGFNEATDDGNLVMATVSCSDLIAHHDLGSGALAPSVSWEHADAIVSTVSQVHVPGAQLTAIPEEAEDVSSLDLSPYAATSLCSRATFIRLSDNGGDFLAELATARTIASIPSSRRSSQDLSEDYWQDERSWRDGGAASRHTGEAL